MRCPACEEERLQQIGELSRIPGLFELPKPGFLHYCRNCHLFFRHPFPSSSELVETYKRVPETHWQYKGIRNDYKLAFSALMKLKQSGNILDVGCYRGDFLQLFPDGFSRYGIEPSQAAARTAEIRGINILGDTVEQVDFKGLRFDIITLIDVLEHLHSPFQTLKKLATLLNAGGILLSTTGNTNSLLWRLMRLDYWYYTPEHISFFNPRWFRWASKQLDLPIIRMYKLSHHEGSLWESYRQFFQGLTFLFLKRLSRHTILKNLLSRLYPFNRAVHWTHSPPAMSYKDHLLVALQAERV